MYEKSGVSTLVGAGVGLCVRTSVANVGWAVCRRKFGTPVVRNRVGVQGWMARCCDPALIPVSSSQSLIDSFFVHAIEEFVHSFAPKKTLLIGYSQ